MAWQELSALLGQWFPKNPFALTEDSLFFWPGVLGYLGIGLGLYLFRPRRRETLREFLLPARLYGSRSFRLDVVFYVVATLGSLFLFSWWFSQISTLIKAGSGWVLAHCALCIDPLAMGTWVRRAAYTLLTFAGGDLGFYAWHRWMHTSPILWEFHKVHHTATALTPFTAARSHPVESVLSATAFNLGAVAAMLSFAMVLGEKPSLIVLMGSNAIGFLFALINNASHSHLWWSWGPVVGRILISPAYHQIHHSRDSRHANRNFGRTFAMWDWWFGTLYLPGAREDISYGVSEEEDRHYTTLGALFFRPFVGCYQLLAKRAGAARTRGAKSNA